MDGGDEDELGRKVGEVGSNAEGVLFFEDLHAGLEGRVRRLDLLQIL